MTEKFEEFKKLVEEWSKDMGCLSGGFDKHPNMRKIGDKALCAYLDYMGYTCLLIDTYPHMVFAILDRLIPSENHPPIDPYYAGRIPVIIECYKYWALKKGFVSVKYDPQSYWVEDKYGNRGEWH
jgi:hypothetical protein